MRKPAISKFIPFIIFFLISIIYASPILKNISYWGQMDWDQFSFWNAVPRDTLLRYRQFPLWNPYSNGGNVMLALPHSSFLSPLFVLVLLFGPIIGLKLQWVISIFIGMAGMFFLSGHFGIGKISRYLPSAIFMLSSLFTLHLTEGHAEFMAMGFLPWVFLFILNSHKSKKYFFFSAFFLSIMILGGSVYVFNITIVFIIIYFILLSFKEAKRKYILLLTGIFACTILFCSIKLIPVLGFLKDYPRKIESNEKVDISLLPTILLSQKQDFLYQNTKWANPQERVEADGREFEYGWHEFGAYIGVASLILAAIGMFFYCRQHLPLLITGILSLWVSLGGGAFYNLWALLRKLPIYASLHVPSRFILWFIFCISIFAGLGLSRLESTARKKRHEFLIVIIIVAVFLDLFLVNRDLMRNIFTMKPPRIHRSLEFKQRYRYFNLFPKRSRSSMCAALLSNSGMINSYEVSGIDRGDLKIAGETGYRGEVYLAKHKGNALITYFSPNKIVVDIDAEGDDMLVINQNYYNGWRVRKRQDTAFAESFNGLIAAPVQSQDKTATFYFLPVSFLIGLSVTLVSATIGITVALIPLKKCV